MQNKRKEVRKEIIDSFASSTYPGDSHLVEISPDPDFEEMFDILQGQSWQKFLSHLEQIDGPELYWFSWIYTMLTPKAFYYYLPAFLIVTLDLRRVDTVGTHLLSFLESPDEQSSFRKRYVNEVRNRTTPSQRRAIQKWARCMLEEYPEDLHVQPLHYWL